MGGRRILVVDDCSDTVELVSSLLSMLGHACCGVLNGTDAIAAAATFEPEIVLLDLALPDMNGYDVARALRSRWASRLFVVALTGYGTPRDRELTRTSGFDHHLLKPIGRARLCEVISIAERVKPWAS